MLKLVTAAQRWRHEDFATTLKREIESLHQDALPLQQALTQGGLIDDNTFTVTVLGAADAGQDIEAKIGVMFVEIVGGCSCGDEPTDYPGYCELHLLIDKLTGEAKVGLGSVAWTAQH